MSQFADDAARSTAPGRRRLLLGGAAVAAYLAAEVGALPGAATGVGPPTDALVEPRALSDGTPAGGRSGVAPARADDQDRAALMAEAFEQRRRAVEAGDQPFGAVVVKDGAVVGEGPSRVVVAGDPTAHAELEAIRDAARRLGTRDLAGCELYATSRPCRMCEAAAYWARVSRVYHGSGATDAGPPSLGGC